MKAKVYELRRGLLKSRSVVCLALVLGFAQPLFAQGDGTLKWTFDTGGAIKAAPAIGEGNVLYVASADGNLYAINPDGTERWRAAVGDVGDVRFAPVIAPDGTIYVGDHSEGKVTAVNVDDGSVNWTFVPGGGARAVSGAMALAADGTLYAGMGGSGSERPTVYAINPDGSEFWSFPVPSGPAFGISVGPNGTVCFTDASQGVTLLDSLGSQLWRVVPRGTFNPPIFGEDGTVYYVWRAAGALNFADGSLKWEVDPGPESRAPASTGPNGELYVPLGISGAGGVAALDPDDGSEIWTFETSSPVSTTPAVGLDGTIYFGSDTHELIALNPDGTLKWKFEAAGPIRSSPTIAENGTLYFGSAGNDGTFYALNSSSQGLAASSWPKYQRDIRNTGRFGSDISRRRFFAPHVFDLSEKSVAVLTMSHVDIPGSSGVLGTTANFRVDVRRRDGSLLFSIDESVEPGETKDILLRDPNGGGLYQGSAVVDAQIKDGLALLPFLTWSLDLGFNAPLQIGAFFSDPTEAAQVHYFPAEASATNGLGIALQNIGNLEVLCTLDFLSADGTEAGQEIIELQALGSLVDFFSDPPAEGFKGRATLTCDAPVVVVAVNQDSSNGNFPTDRLTIKGAN